MESAANRRLFWTTAGAVVAADLVTKLLAESLLARHLPVQVIGEYVQLRLVYNQCARSGCVSRLLALDLLRARDRRAVRAALHGDLARPATGFRLLAWRSCAPERSGT